MSQSAEKVTTLVLEPATKGPSVYWYIVAVWALGIAAATLLAQPAAEAAVIFMW